MRYIPFLKFKTNEVAALKELDKVLHENLIPFFDLARKDDMDEDNFKKMVQQLFRKYQINLTRLPAFYLDNYDIDDALVIDSEENYKYVLDSFITSKIIPVVGLDRSPKRNQLVFDYSSKFLSKTVAVRLTNEDLDYDLILDDLEELLEACFKSFIKVDLIIDNRVCLNTNSDERANEIVEFIDAILGENSFNKIIVTGSSIPASIREILDTGEQKNLVRNEIKIFRSIKQKHNDIYLGDYTVVSPNYSDVKVKGELMGKVSTPKVFYAFDDTLFVTRGYAFDTNPRGLKQYNDLSKIVISQSFYRKKENSFGDNYIYEQAHDLSKKNATPSSIIKPLVNIHISYMLKDFKF